MNDREQILLQSESVSVRWDENNQILIILTRHGLIRILPERKKEHGPYTRIYINVDGKEMDYDFRPGDDEDVMSVYANGYTPVSNGYWGELK